VARAATVHSGIEKLLQLFSVNSKSYQNSLVFDRVIPTTKRRGRFFLKGQGGSVEDRISGSHLLPANCIQQIIH